MDHLQIIQQFLGVNQGLGIHPYGDGLIHQTYIVGEQKEEPLFILQRVNHHVFKKPDDIASNLDLLHSFLTSSGIADLFPMPLKTTDGKDYVVTEGNYYRLIPFVKDTHTLNECRTPEEAYEAAFQFGHFTASFDTFDANQLKETIPGFHDLSFRWEQFTTALEKGNAERIKFASNEIALAQQHYEIVRKYNSILNSGLFKKRVTHHDTKINNVLFDRESKGVCVIDLDTVMSGYFISDLGDMFRTYLSPANEEATDFSTVVPNPEFYKAILEGYLEQMADHLTVDEKENLDYAGEFMIYMQALRFLTDFLNNDTYYGIRYELNNYNRAINQFTLLEAFQQIR